MLERINNNKLLLEIGLKAGIILNSRTRINNPDKINRVKIRTEVATKDKAEVTKDKTEEDLVLEEDSTTMVQETMVVNSEATKIGIKVLEIKTEDLDTTQLSIRTMTHISRTDIEQ